MKQIIVGVDRDGTLTEDENYFLGCSDNWREQVKILKGVSEGIRLLNSEGIKVFMITNQSGIALDGESKEGANFSNLTEERVVEVNNFIVKKLKDEGAKIDGCFLCPFISSHYAKEKNEEGCSVNKDFLSSETEDRKPNIGMLKKAAKSVGEDLENCRVYFIGDRETDVQTGLNAKGMGILVPSGKTIKRGDVEKVEKLKKEYLNRVFIFDDFLKAAEFVVKQTK